MVFAYTFGRIGLAGAGTHRSRGTGSMFAMRAASSCASGGFYLSPTAGQTVNTTQPTLISWDPTCLQPTPQYVDIYLYAPGQNDSLIQAYNGADYKHGSMETTLNPNWWGMSASVSLQLTIVPHGNPSFLTTLAAGPVFTATYNSSNPNAVPKTTTPSGNGKSSIIQDVESMFHNMSGGAIAAAVIIPILIVALGIAVYIRHARRKRAEKTKRWSQAVDNRMSTISTDWRSMSGASANAAIRNSMAIRTSSFERPSSMLSGGQAGVGARFGGLQTSEQEIPQMSQMRQARTSTFTSSDRVSRVSFAADPRISIHDSAVPPLPTPSSRIYQTRSFHQSQTAFDDENAGDLQMSPTQTHGALPLSNADIVARASFGDEEFRKEVLQMPAMTLMRTGQQSDKNGLGELVLPPSILRNSIANSVSSGGSRAPAVPLPTLKTNTAVPPMGMMPPSNALSPDDMLRAYAAGRAATPSAPVGQNTGMRVLYSSASPAPVDNNPFRKSMAARSEYTNSMYSGMVEEDDSHHFRGSAQ